MPTILFVNLLIMKKQYLVTFTRTYKGTCTIEAENKKQAEEKYYELDYDTETDHESYSGEKILAVELKFSHEKISKKITKIFNNLIID